MKMDDERSRARTAALATGRFKDAVSGSSGSRRVCVIGSATIPAEAAALVDFPRMAGPQRWFEKDTDFDRRFREHFLSLHEAATIGDLADWLATPKAAFSAGAAAGSVSAQRISRHIADVR